MSLQGRTVLVTGGGSGIGRSTAEAFGREGALVAVLDAIVRSAQETVGNLERFGAKAMAIEADVTRPSEVADAVTQVVAAWGRLDCAVNNAGVEGALGRLADYDVAEFDRVIGVNLRGTFFCMQNEIRAMLGQRNGSIVNISSAAGITPAPAMPAYVASKAAIVQLTRSAALDYAVDGIRVNAVCPGPVQTPMQERVRGEGSNLSEAAVPLGRTADPSEIASAVLWLCSDAASYVTGHAMVVDGGCLTQGPRQQAR